MLLPMARTSINLPGGMIRAYPALFSAAGEIVSDVFPPFHADTEDWGGVYPGDEWSIPPFHLSNRH
jgi:hypothetical protein